MDPLRKRTFLYCFYQIRQNKHVNFHHVLIPLDLITNEEYLKNLKGDGYEYFLMSQVPILLSESEYRSEINRPLIMDGESLWKRMKRNRSLNNNNNHEGN
jgi:hypothetical protein